MPHHVAFTPDPTTRLHPSPANQRISILFRRLLCLICVTLATCLSPAIAQQTTSPAMVSSAHPLATEAGVRVLKAGGNAVDAAVAVALTLGVVDGHNSGIGGGCFMLIYRADAQIVVIDGRETAPAAARRDMYLRDGDVVPGLSTDGALASGVPGALAAYELALREHGTLQLSELILPAANLAEEGFAIDDTYARRLAATADSLRRQNFPANFFNADGSPLNAGDVLRQPDLAASYRAISRQGAAWFYKGAYAAAVADWMSQNGGILTAADFAAYTPVTRRPLRASYHGYEVVGVPPPSSGGVHVAQILNILEAFDLKALSAPGAREHLIIEAMKLAFADRAFWLGDPAFADVPEGLINKDYARRLAQRIHPDRTSAVPGHNTPPDTADRLFEKHTTHFAVVDSIGNWVSCTATINTSFGSKVIVPGTGIILNNEMDDFSIQPGVPNAFGLIGAEANAIAPGKRPLSSMSPTLVLKDGKPLLAIGAAGGPTIISQVVLGIVGTIDLELPLETAVAQPRFHHQWHPDQVRVEEAFPAPVRQALEQRGHHLAEVPTIGVTHAIARTPDGHLAGAADPRAGGQSQGID